MAEAMSEERLALEMRQLRQRAHDAETRGEELQAEVDRLRAVEVRMRAVINEDITAYETQLNAIHEARDYWQDKTVKATTRAETAERELAELRERIGTVRQELRELSGNQAAASEGNDFAAGYANGIGDAYRAAASLLGDVIPAEQQHEDGNHG